MDRFSSRFGFLLAAIGAAVGLGNVALPWQYTGPGVELVGRLPRASVLVGIGLALFLLGRALARWFPGRPERRRGRYDDTWFVGA